MQAVHMDSTHDPLAMAKGRKRPRSRGSTASIHSAATHTTQPNLDHSFAEGSEVYSTQWIPTDHGHPRELANGASQMTTEDLILASQLQASRDFSIDQPVNTSLQNVSFHPGHSHSMSRQSMSVDSFAGNTSFADDSQMMDRDANDDGDSFSGLAGQMKPGSRSSANNEMEMRQLFHSNKHRNLVDVAEELHGNERGPNSERTRQVFAMLWISQVCDKGKGSVPRGRVYANYASRCATERITVLNPASFGKLVRVLFPGLKTRRLGVRGESKYHYVNFTLMEEQPDLREPPAQPQVPLGESASFSQNFNTVPKPSASMQADRAELSMLDATKQQPEPKSSRSHEFQHSLYNQPQVSTFDQLQTTMTKTAQRLCFSAETGESFQQSDPLLLPRIEPFLPSGTDPDAAKSLAALYRSHCTSLVECIRYCKEKTFFHLFTSFQGTLTMPVQKLFANPAVAPWIEESDFVLYQRMMRIVSGLTLQVVPKPVLDTLRSISEKLVTHIRESFQGQPLHVIRAKEAPATIFAGLLDRALRVNLTAHAAANMLYNPANRDLMYKEWISMINVRKVAESVPSRGMDDVVDLLLSEMRDLLDPVNIPWEIECLTLHGEMAMRQGRPPQEGNPEDSTASNVLDRWVNFLRSLPHHFPYASHTDIVWCVQRLSTSVMRDLTIAQGKSFGSWWVTKCWIDEMIQFLAEHGGFLKQKAAQSPLEVPKQQATSRLLSNPGSRYSSTSEDFNMSRLSDSQPDRAPFPSGPSGNNTQQTNHDDSGIGIRTPDEDLPGEKFGLGTANTQDLFAGTELQDHLTDA
ncbi:RFX DNA-binding domain-containing protein [Lasiosphaeria miniovina]|uniref:RFX DNA-binding domain-containing protein n=1 Tax=Lasiosphaeria miniovina TaxID=1954250 RepID=A0AA40B604_9PEZI|nr:RFX DNA-binding domain-containing protein [Lasiosphaeria miniovina]KAK0727958.1 RFX DNA-binding domain-containing protein [Lasiosphaeria miniovina]